MAVWSTISLSALEGARRLDAEYYEPCYFANLKSVCAAGSATGWRSATVWELVRSIKGSAFYPPFVEHYGGEGMPFVRVSDLGDFFLRENRLVRVASDTLKRYRQIARLHEGDILLAKGGSIGGISAVQEGLGEVAVCRDVIALETDPARIAPYYLVAFLLSKFGQLQLDRNKSQQVQAHLTFPAVGMIRVAVPPSALQTAVSELVRMGYSERKRAENLQAEAEAILTAAVGLDRVDRTLRLSYEGSYAHAANAGRFDAEYFSPRMQNVIETLSVGGETIGDVASLAKRRFKAVSGKPFEYVEIANVDTAGIARSNTIAGEDAPSRATWIVKPGDIITTTVRPIRRLSAIILPEQDGFVCSSGFAVLRSGDIEPELLLTYLRLPLVVELLDLHTTASMYPAISTSDLLRIPVRLPDAQTREKIVAKVHESFVACAESHRLLDEAKRTVEAAIMEGSQAHHDRPCALETRTASGPFSGG